jgi:hypothetical protein
VAAGDVNVSEHDNPDSPKSWLRGRIWSSSVRDGHQPGHAQQILARVSPNDVPVGISATAESLVPFLMPRGVPVGG